MRRRVYQVYISTNSYNINNITIIKFSKHNKVLYIESVRPSLPFTIVVIMFQPNPLATGKTYGNQPYLISYTESF